MFKIGDKVVFVDIINLEKIGIELNKVYTICDIIYFSNNIIKTHINSNIIRSIKIEGLLTYNFSIQRFKKYDYRLEKLLKLKEIINESR